MPKAEVGSTKWVANKSKAKGLQRLRWYCQICEKQCRDENGFKQHTMSEGHVRAMLTVGENPRNVINEYSNDFKRDFLKLLSTQHGEKKVNMNHFYQDYIKDKEHVHMNATKWPSLTEFAKYLGREGICRVEEGERGLEIMWIDDSPGAIQRRDAVKRAEARIQGDEDAESRALKAQMKRAKEAAKANGQLEEDKEKERERIMASLPASDEPVQLSFSLGKKAGDKAKPTPKNGESEDKPVSIDNFTATDAVDRPGAADKKGQEEHSSALKPTGTTEGSTKDVVPTPALQAPAKRVNPLKRKNPLAGKKRAELAPELQEKKMSNAERIMKEEMERNKLGPQRGDFGGGKKQRRF